MIKHNFSLQASVLALFTVCVCLPILFSKFTFPCKSLTSGWKCCSVPLWYDVWKLCVYKRPKTFCAGSAPWYQLGDPSTAVEKRQPQGSGLHRKLELLERNSTVSKRGAARRFPWLTYIDLFNSSTLNIFLWIFLPRFFVRKHSLFGDLNIW